MLLNYTPLHKPNTIHHTPQCSSHHHRLGCGFDFSLAVSASGDLLGFGNLSDIGADLTSADKVTQPTAIAMGGKFTDVSCGRSHCAAIDEQGKVRCHMHDSALSHTAYTINIYVCGAPST